MESQVKGSGKIQDGKEWDNRRGWGETEPDLESARKREGSGNEEIGKVER